METHLSGENGPAQSGTRSLLNIWCVLRSLLRFLYFWAYSWGACEVLDLLLSFKQEKAERQNKRKKIVLWNASSKEKVKEYFSANNFLLLIVSVSLLRTTKHMQNLNKRQRKSKMTITLKQINKCNIKSLWLKINEGSKWAQNTLECLF